jgi:hypothetical protein
MRVGAQVTTEAPKFIFRAEFWLAGSAKKKGRARCEPCPFLRFTLGRLFRLRLHLLELVLQLLNRRLGVFIRMGKR